MTEPTAQAAGSVKLGVILMLLDASAFGSLILKRVLFQHAKGAQQKRRGP